MDERNKKTRLTSRDTRKEYHNPPITKTYSVGVWNYFIYNNQAV